MFQSKKKGVQAEEIEEIIVSFGLNWRLLEFIRI